MKALALTVQTFTPDLAPPSLSSSWNKRDYSISQEFVAILDTQSNTHTGNYLYSTLQSAERERKDNRDKKEIPYGIKFTAASGACYIAQESMCPLLVSQGRMAHQLSNKLNMVLHYIASKQLPKL